MTDGKKLCKTADTKDAINFQSSNINLYGIPEKIKSNKGELPFPKSIGNFAKTEILNMNIAHPEYRAHAGNGAVERAIQTLKNLIIANIEDGLSLTESVN